MEGNRPATEGLNLSRQQQGGAAISLSQRCEDIREDLVQVGTTTRNQRQLPAEATQKIP